MRKMCSGGGIGRRVWLRSIWSDPWGFKSPLEYHALIAQSVEHFLGKEEVTGSSPVEGSIFQIAEVRWSVKCVECDSVRSRYDCRVDFLREIIT